MKTYDLIRRYGWEAMPVLANVGKPMVAGNVYFVDSGATNATDANDGEHGNSWEMPFATLDYAVGKCTANQGDVILVQQGHAEDLTATNVIDVDVAGVTILGMGIGEDRPTFTYDHADALFTIGASNVTIKGLRFMPSVTIVTNAISVETTLQGILIEDCEFAPGEAGDGTDEFVDTLSFVSTDDDCIVRKCVFRTHSACNGAASAITTLAACDRMLIEDNIFVGAYSTAAIKGVAADLECIIRNNVMKVTDGEPGIELHANTTGIIANNLIESTGIAPDVAIVAADCSWFDNKCVYTDGEAAVIIGGGEVTTETAAALVAVNLDHVAATTTTVAADADLTTYVADGSILSHIMTAGADTSDYQASTDSLEAISTAVAAITENVSTAVPEPPVAKSLHDTLHKDGSYTYDNTTDSLEAISDALAAGTGCTTAIEADNLDTIAGADTSVVADGDLTTHAVDGSVLSHIMTKGADTSDYAASTDSLEALSDKAGGFSGDGGANQDDSIKASLDLAHTDLDTIVTQTPAIVVKNTGDMSSGYGTAQSPVSLFTVTGDVLCRVCASVNTGVTSTSNNGTLEVGIAGNTACLCVQDVADGTAFDVGDSWSLITAADANGAQFADEWCIVGNGSDIILTIGTNNMTAGDIDFYCEWKPLSSGATVVAA